MKKINKLAAIAFAVVIVSFFGCGADKVEDNITEEHVPVEINMENLTVVDYGVEGMVCAMGCAATIQEEVVNMSGVAVSHVDYEEEKAHFEFDAAIVSEEEIIAKIESIADGQYKVIEWVEKDNEEVIEDESEVVEGNSADESAELEVKLPSFEIPNLFTLILDQI